jgi:hypothetical protein
MAADFLAQLTAQGRTMTTILKTNQSPDGKKAGRRPQLL